MADQVQQVVSDIPQWMRDLMFGSKPAGMSDADWARVQQSGFQGLIPQAYSAARGMAPSAEQQAALGAGIPEQRVAGLDALTQQAQDMAMRSVGVAPSGSTPAEAQAFAANRNLAEQVMRGQVDFNSLTPEQQRAVSQMDLGYAPYLQSAQDAFGLSAAGFGAGQGLLQQGIGSALQFGGDPVARAQLQQQIAGLSPEQQQQALREFDSQTAYGRLGTSQQSLLGTDATRSNVYSTAQTNVDAYRDWLNTQTTGAPSSEDIRNAGKGVNPTITEAINAGGTNVGNRVTGITSALETAGKDFSDLSDLLQQQGTDLKNLPKNVRDNLTTAAGAYTTRLGELDTETASQAGITQRQVNDALTAAGGNVDAALSSLKQQGIDLNSLPATTRNRLIAAAEAANERLEELDKNALDQAGITQRQVNDALTAAGGNVDAALSSLKQQGIDLNSLPATTRNRLISAAESAHDRLEQLDKGALDQAGITQRQLDETVRGARRIADTAATTLLGAGSKFDPENTQAFMDPYRRDVVDAQQREMQRLADIQRQDIRAQAVQAGAFGGSREAVQQAELTRNLTDQQSRVAAELMSQGYTQAQANAMQAFEQAQQRQLQGAVQAGQIGLSAEQLASQTHAAGGQMGLSALQDVMRNAQFMSQQGLSAEEIAARTGLSAQQLRQAGFTESANLAQSMGSLTAQSQLAAGNIGLNASQIAAQNAQFMSQQGLSAEEVAARTGLSAQQLRQAGFTESANLAQSMGSLTAQSQLAAGNIGLNASQIAVQNAQYLANLGMSAEEIAARTGLSAQQLQQTGILGEIGAVQQRANTAIQGQGAAGGLQQQQKQQELQMLESMAQRNLSAEQIAAQTRLSEAQMGQAGRIAGMEGAMNLGNLGLQSTGQGIQSADLLRTLGATQAQMAGQEFDIFRQAGMGSFAGAEALGTLGSRQLQQAELANSLQGSDINRLLSFGTLQQGQQQLGMDVNFQNQMRQWSAPMQQTQWLGDFVRGFPSGQTSTAMTAQAQPGWGQQLLGAGIAGLGLAAGKSNFGFGS